MLQQQIKSIMSDHVHLPNAAFDHARLHLAPPNGLQGGAYFAMLYYKDAPLYIQTPKCTSRQGVVPGKRSYIDLMFSSNDTSFLEWLEALEADAVRLIYEKRNLWFSGGDLEKSDIEAGFTSPVRPYKGGKHYLIRAHVHPAKHLSSGQACSVFDENERPASVDYIKAEHQMYTVIEFQGIKFTARSYQLDVSLKQVLIVSNVPMFQSCVIRKPPKHEESMLQERQEESKEAQEESKEVQEESKEVQEESKEVQEESKESKEAQEPDNDQEMQEVNLDGLEELEHLHIKLKTPTEVYYNMYRIAKQKAKDLKKNAIAAYLEARQIKSAHMLEDSDSDSDGDNRID
jgi:hypothetical protein